MGGRKPRMKKNTSLPCTSYLKHRLQYCNSKARTSITQGSSELKSGPVSGLKMSMVKVNGRQKLKKLPHI